MDKFAGITRLLEQSQAMTSYVTCLCWLQKQDIYESIQLHTLAQTGGALIQAHVVS